MNVDVLLFEGITALDAVGPYEVLSRLPDTTVRFVAETTGPKRTDNGSLALVADFALEDAQSGEVLVVPGGFGIRPLLADVTLLEWVRARHSTSTWTTSVCTGALLLAAAGILHGLPATTHWASMERLGELGAVTSEERVVEAGKIITGAGVSAGIDLALTLAARLAGEDVARDIQTQIEYDPQPPFAYAR